MNINCVLVVSYPRGGFSDPLFFDLEASPRLNLTPSSPESEYYGEQSRDANACVRSDFGLPVASLWVITSSSALRYGDIPVSQKPQWVKVGYR